jgi:hypothetical protein
MCLNVFIDIVIEFHHHFLIVMFFAIHTHLHFFFSLYTMTPFPTCYTTTFFFFHSCWSIPIFIQSILTFHVYTSPHIPHSMSSLVAWSIAEPKFISWILDSKIYLLTFMLKVIGNIFNMVVYAYFVTIEFKF